MIFSKATVTDLGLARVLVFIILIIDLLIDDLPANAIWGMGNFHPHGLLALIPESTLSFLLSENGLIGFRYFYLSVLTLGLIGLGPSWLVVGITLICTIWFHGLARGFGGHVNHQEIIVLHALFFLFPSVAFRAYTLKAKKHLLSSNPSKSDNFQARLLLQLLTFWVLLTYFYIGLARVATSDVRVYFSNTMLRYVVHHCHKFNWWDISLAKDVLNHVWFARFLMVSFFFATILELIAPLALFVRRFTLTIVFSLIAFHISIWVFMNIFFWQNLCLLLLPLLGWYVDHKRSAADVGEKIIFFDAKCGLCDGFIQLVSRLDHLDCFKFSPLNGETANSNGIRLVEDRKEWTIMLLENGHLYDRSTAVIHILKSLPRLSFLGDLILLIPCAIRDLFYRIVARMRYRFFGEVSVCGLPPEDIKSKLLK